MILWADRRIFRVVSLEAIESSACEVVGREDSVPTPTDHSFGPDIIRVKEVEDIDQKLNGQVVEGVTCIGYQALDESLFTSPERADQIGETIRGQHSSHVGHAS